MATIEKDTGAKKIVKGVDSVSDLLRLPTIQKVDGIIVTDYGRDTIIDYDEVVELIEKYAGVPILLYTKDTMEDAPANVDVVNTTTDVVYESVLLDYILFIIELQEEEKEEVNQAQ